MSKKKPRPKRAVKPPNLATLRKLSARLAALSIDWDALARAKKPSWFHALDSALDQPHPVEEQANALIDAHPKLHGQRRAMLTLCSQFQESLPAAHHTVWLDVDRVRGEWCALETMISFNLGVDAGRDATVAERALADGGVDLGSLDARTLFVITTIIADLARHLPIVDGSNGAQL
jgi:hypothetical protein